MEHERDSARERRAATYVGVSEGTEEGRDAPLQAVGDAHPDIPFRVVHVEFAAHNPYITAYRVIVTPGG